MPTRATAKRSTRPTNVRTRTFAPRVVREFDVQSGDPELQPSNNVEYQRRFLAEGDSWFSIDAIPRSANVLEQLPLAQRAIALSLANPGDTIRKMAEMGTGSSLERFLGNAQFAPTWDAILLSGGGNDLIDAMHGIVVNGTGNDPAAYVNASALGALVDSVESHYARIVALRDKPGSVNAGTPIVAHTYDYAMPRNAPALVFGGQLSGPWLFPAFEARGIADSELRFDIARLAIDALALRLMSLQDQFENFVVVDTRGQLTPAAADAPRNSNDWVNEIHPNSHGYAKIAAHIVATAGL
jgi:GDSL-like Lipase/Acylhydrolase family